METAERKYCEAQIVRCGNSFIAELSMEFDAHISGSFSRRFYRWAVSTGDEIALEYR